MISKFPKKFNLIPHIILNGFLFFPQINYLKFIQEKSSSDIQKPAEKTADDPKAPNVGWTDPRKSGGDDDRGDSRQEESKYKLFESNNRENKNIFKLR